MPLLINRMASSLSSRPQPVISLLKPFTATKSFFQKEKLQPFTPSMEQGLLKTENNLEINELCHAFMRWEIPLSNQRTQHCFRFSRSFVVSSSINVLLPRK